MYEKLFNTLFASIFWFYFFSTLEYLYRGIAHLYFWQVLLKIIHVTDITINWASHAFQTYQINQLYLAEGKIAPGVFILPLWVMQNYQ